MAGDWLAARRTEVAADRILDAADDLFARQEAATVGMNEIASAAGCSRATLYRYFENREALYTAYVHRESYRLYREMTEQITSIDDPRERLIEGMMTSLRNVRESPALASWFATTAAADRCGDGRAVRGDQGVDRSVRVSLAPDDADVVERTGPLAGAGDDVTAGVPRPRRGRRTRDARGVRRADGGAEPVGVDEIAVSGRGWQVWVGRAGRDGRVLLQAGLEFGIIL